MRIIAGKLKGRRLAPVRDPGIRPTADRVRESLFGILQGALPGARFLDLCAGTGSIGLEAYSRGATHVTFVEPYTSRTLRENLRRCGLAESVRVLVKPAHRALKFLADEGALFDIIFIDPPYDSPVLEQALNACEKFALLSAEGCLVAEHRQSHRLPENVGQLVCVRHERYGDTMLSFYVLEAES